MSTERPKPQQHNSGLQLISQCGYKYYLKYILKKRMPATSHLHVGRGVDQAATMNLRNKIENAVLLPVAQVVDKARDVVRKSISDEGIAITPDEEGMSERAAADRAVDKTVRLATAHAEKLAPKLRPKAVAIQWSLTVAGFPFDIVGERDLDDVDDVIHDLKTGKKSPPKNAADVSDQGTSYTLAKHMIEKTPLPIKFQLDVIADLKTQTKVCEPLISTRDKTDFQVILNRYEASARVIETGAFMPANQTDWWCSLAWCEYAPECKYFRRPKTLVLDEGD